MKTEKLFPLLVLCILVVAACNKDEDETETPSDTVSFPYESQYSGAEEIDFRIWTNGEEISTEGLNPADYLETTSLENYNNIENFDINFTFTPDSLILSTIDSDPVSYGYKFENGKLIINELDLNGDSFSYTLGYGSINSFEIRAGYFTYCKLLDDWPFRDCEDQSSEFYFYTLDSVSSELGINDVLTEMTQEDTLTIYNYRLLFN